MSDKPKNLEIIAQNGAHVFDVTFTDRPGGDPVQPTRLSGAEQFDPLTDDPADFVTPQVRIWDEDTETLIAPPGAYNEPSLDPVAYGGTTGKFTVNVVGNNTRKSSDLVNQRWALVWTTEINGNTFTDYEFFTVLDDGAAEFGGVESAYGDTDLVQDRAGVTAADLGLDGTDYNDLLQELNRRASACIDDYCDRDFRLHDNDVIKLDGTDSKEMLLPGYPVIEITTVKQDGVALAASEYRLQSNQGPRVDRNSGILERRRPQVWDQDWERYEVTYTWGYESPPAAISEVADALITRALQHAKTSVQAAGVQSWSMDGYSVTYDKELFRGFLTDADKAKMGAHKRILAV